MGNSWQGMIQVGAVLALLLTVVVLAPSVAVAAGSTTVAIEGVGYQVSHPMADNLKSFTGKKVSVTVAAGKTFTGTVKEVGSHLVHLEQLEGKEHFDALISLDSIVAIEARFRKIQR